MQDKDGLMSHAEFLRPCCFGPVSCMEIRILETPEGLRALETVGVDPVGLIDYADTIFSQARRALKSPFRFLLSSFKPFEALFEGDRICCCGL